MRNYKLILFSLLALGLLAQCQQPTGTEAVVTIPQLQISCTASNCASSSSNPKLFVYITTSGCLSIAYGQVATGTGTISCSAGSCTAASLTWVNAAGASTTQIASNTYDFCAIIDLTGTYAGVSVPSGDATSSSSAFVGSATSPVTSISLSSWINGSFVK